MDVLLVERGWKVLRRTRGVKVAFAVCFGQVEKSWKVRELISFERVAWVIHLFSDIREAVP